jgi:hypothetical protein
MSVVNGNPEFSFKLIANRGEKAETFIIYGNGLERKGWEIQNGWGWVLSAARFLKSYPFISGTVGRNHVNAGI